MSGKLQRVNAFTVDLEDWFQGLTSTNPQVDKWQSFESRVVSATQSLLDLLRSYQVQATFFVLGYVADQFPALIEDIRADGHEIGVHGYYHRFVSRSTPDEFARDLERSIQAVERVSGESPLGYRAPYFISPSTGARRGSLTFCRRRGCATTAAFSRRVARCTASRKRRAFPIL
jgi:hypothetical protein